MRRDQRQGRASDDARGRRRAALPRGLEHCRHQLDSRLKALARALAGPDRLALTEGPSQEVQLRLRDGSMVAVRAVRPDDKDALKLGFSRLSEQSRYQRFLTAITELSDADLRYLTEVDHHEHEALVAFDSRSGDAVAVARFVRLADGTSAESAVTVIDEWQGRGAGTAICNLLAERAREEGIDRFTALLLAANEQMHDVLATLGPAKVISRDAGTVVVEVAIPEQGIGDHMAGVLRVTAGGTVELATPPWGLRTTPPPPGDARR